MDYFFSKILLDLQKRISKELPVIQFIDQDLGQLGQEGENGRPPLAYPAVLIDFPNSDYSELSSSAQLGNVPITFQLIFDNYSSTWHKAPLRDRMKGLEYLDIEQKLFNILNGWHEDYFTPLIRTNVKSQNNNDIGLRVRQLTFTTSYEDYSTSQDEYKEVVFTFNGGLKTN
ncbi:hypothetical protein [Epilithonimonas xixisoli]|uniref:Uncharacterized protein n=1 Tax=Epilithonimonas xixisoli TaxID=1476462 RepID=A0A4R8IH74_9FLAO|nr:hypothetical protein [Epilithonimonas xixisoli]TDX86193.1 hypothetical protein B0I22_0303 [Epilithonimonas xixisoli]